MVYLFESILNTFSPDVISNLIILCIIVVFAFALYFSIVNKAKVFVSNAPMLLTSIGILGTFIGISIGLTYFDPNNIDGSIASLLNGMKTAFFTSLAGMALSIIFKILQPFVKKADGTEITEDVTFEELINTIHTQNESLKSLVSTIGGESDTSILSQMKMLRTEINDSNKITQKIIVDINESLKVVIQHEETHKETFNEFMTELWRQLINFSEILSKSATEAVINALKQVIVDFNNNLTEQFGDNFKELNSAVKDLIVWQENYKSIIEKMTHQYEVSVKLIDDIEKSINNISDNASLIPKNMEKLCDITEIQQHQINELSERLDSFREIRDKAVEAIPVINSQIDKTISSVSEVSEKVVNKIDSITNSISNAADNNISTCNKFIGTTQEIHDKIIQHIHDIQNHMESALDKIFGEHNQNIQKVFFNIDAGLRTQVERTGSAVEKQLDMIDKSMQDELTRVMNTMGKALGQISNQFTNDYSKLVNEMKKIVSNR